MSPYIKDHDKGFNSCIASALRARRAQVGLTYEELADKTGIPRISLARLFTEKRPIYVTQLASIAEALQTTPEELTREAERESMRRHGNPWGFPQEEPDNALNLEDYRKGTDSVSAQELATSTPPHHSTASTQSPTQKKH